jgi:uncharacterized protein DUF6879
MSEQPTRTMACMADAVPMSEAQLDEIERRLIGACRVAPPPWVEGLETLDDCLRQRTRSALHLELRDAYTLSDPLFLAWKAGQRADPQDRALWRPWLERMQEVTGRGVDVRRARIVSEPVSEYIRFEYDITFMNLAAGEQSTVAAPTPGHRHPAAGNDFWLFDDELAAINHFSGVDEWLDIELTSEPAITGLCRSAFARVWERATPHDAFRPA